MSGLPPVPRLTVLYRGPLASCGNDCPYCPFAKRHDPPEALGEDRAALARFVDWAGQAPVDELSVLFTPWGEGLTRRWYREALVTLSHTPRVRRAVIQTSLPGRVEWAAAADPERLARWCTYHPGQVTAQRYLDRCRELLRFGVRFSVGVVALPEHLDPARWLRAELPEHVYLWANCHIGYVHLRSLPLYAVFGEGVVERIPAGLAVPGPRPGPRPGPALRQAVAVGHLAGWRP